MNGQLGLVLCEATKTSRSGTTMELRPASWAAVERCVQTLVECWSNSARFFPRRAHRQRWAVTQSAHSRAQDRTADRNHSIKFTHVFIEFDMMTIINTLLFFFLRRTSLVSLIFLLLFLVLFSFAYIDSMIASDYFRRCGPRHRRQQKLVHVP